MYGVVPLDMKELDIEVLEVKERVYIGVDLFGGIVYVAGEEGAFGPGRGALQIGKHGGLVSVSSEEGLEGGHGEIAVNEP